VSADLIIAVGFMVIIALIIGGGVWAAFKFGGDKEEADQAKEDLHEASKQLKRRNEPLPDDSTYLGRLRRAQERLARLRDRKAGK
jgi:hypothetical protein